MKKIEREFTRVEKEIYYEAWDGEQFSEPQYCEEYENNARGVIGKKVQPIRVKRTDEFELFMPLGTGFEDNSVEIFLPQNAKDIESLNMYTNMFYKDCKLIEDKWIGEYVLVRFNYDKDWCDVTTFDELIEGLKKHFDKFIPKEEKANE